MFFVEFHACFSQAHEANMLKHKQLIVTTPLWRLSETCVFFMPKSEFRDPTFGTPVARKSQTMGPVTLSIL
jgi:hypothetical protein